MYPGKTEPMIKTPPTPPSVANTCSAHCHPMVFSQLPVPPTTATAEQSVNPEARLLRGVFPTPKQIHREREPLQHFSCLITLLGHLVSGLAVPYRAHLMVGGERTTRASTASSLKLRRANAQRPLTHSRTCLDLTEHKFGCSC